MTEQQILDTITEELCSKHRCHTVILYGSRARGDATEASDYDILGIRDDGESFRDARLWNGVYLDIFVHPTAKLDDPHDGMLDMRLGKVLKEKNDTAKKFFAKLESIFAKGPKKLPADEIAALRTWHHKALDRIRFGGIQGNLRRSELVPALVENYFKTRGEWYRGPKASFLWLKENRPDLYEAFERAFEPVASVETLERLVLLVDKEIEKEARPAKPSSISNSIPRPGIIKNYREIQDPDNACYPGSNELLSIGSPFAKKFGLTKLGIHHEVLPPGRRTSWPHAESEEEEFVYVIEGNPDVWIDGHLHRLNPGDGVGFIPGTGICYTFLNNTESDVRLLVVGEATKKTNKCFYALHPERNEQAKKEGWFWENHPQRTLGDHDGIPDAQKATI